MNPKRAGLVNTFDRHLELALERLQHRTFERRSDLFVGPTLSLEDRVGGRVVVGRRPIGKLDCNLRVGDLTIGEPERTPLRNVRDPATS